MTGVDPAPAAGQPDRPSPSDDAVIAADPPATDVVGQAEGADTAPTPSPPSTPATLRPIRPWLRLLAMAGAAAVGAVLFVIGWTVLGADSQGDAGDAITTGRVVTVVDDASGCRAEATFEARGGTYRARSEPAPTPCPYVVGDEVRVAFRPSAPADATVLDAGPINWWRWVLLLLGSILLLYGVVGVVRYLVIGARAARSRP